MAQVFNAKKGRIFDDIGRTCSDVCRGSQKRFPKSHVGDEDEELCEAYGIPKTEAWKQHDMCTMNCSMCPYNEEEE